MNKSNPITFLFHRTGFAEIDNNSLSKDAPACHIMQNGCRHRNPNLRVDTFVSQNVKLVRKFLYVAESVDTFARGLFPMLLPRRWTQE